MPKKIEPLEITDTAEIPIVSVEIPTEYEDMTPDPVPAIDHVALHSSQMMTFPKRQFDRLLPIVATILMSVAIGATVLGAGVVIGAGL